MKQVKTFRLSAIALALMVAAWQSSQAARPTSGAYATDSQQEYVNDLATEAIAQANNILCYIANTRADSQVNAGTYVAFVDEAACDSSARGSSNNSSNEGSSGSIQYTRMSLTSTRASNTADQIVKGHADVSSNGTSVAVYLYATASEGPSATAPNGVLTMDFSGLVGANNAMRGRISASGTTLTYVETGNQGRPYNIRLSVTGNSTSGKGVVRSNNNDTGTDTTITFGYNATHFCRSKDGGAEQCFERAKEKADSSVWKYGVYNDDTGARYDLATPGFMIKKDGAYGYASYWGVWFPSALADGASVTNDSGDTTYTIKKAEGRLIKRTRSTITTSEAQKIPFTFFVNTTTAVTGGNLTGGTQYETWWDGAKFVITASMGPSGRTPVSGTLTATPVEINSATTIGGFAQGMRGWSQAAQAEIFVPSTTLLGTTSTFVLTREATVQPGETVPSSLSCVRDCPTAAQILAFKNGDQSVADPTNAGWSTNPRAPFTSGTYRKGGNTALASVVTYTWNSSDYTLKDATNTELKSSNLPAQSVLDTNQFRGGVRSGALVDANEVGSTKTLDCDGAGPSTAQCDFKAGSLSSFYVWEMGKQPWNTPTFLKKIDNTYVSFTAPENWTFIVPANASGGTMPYGDFAGANMTLSFQGFGQLFGIPGKCFSTANNTEVACGPNTRYVPAFSIPYSADGKITSGSGANITTKWIKWLDRELRFKRDATATSANKGITMGTAADLPTAITAGGSDDPAVSANSSIYPGAFSQSLFTAKPKVIHGVVQ
jgi:hypothetical protein